MTFVEEHFDQILCIALYLVFAGGIYIVVYSWIFSKSTADCISKAYDNNLDEKDYDELLEEIRRLKAKADKFPYSSIFTYAWPHIFRRRTYQD